MSKVQSRVPGLADTPDYWIVLEEWTRARLTSAGLVCSAGGSRVCDREHCMNMLELL